MSAKSHKRVNITADVRDPTLVGAWNLVHSPDGVTDLSGKGNHGTIYSQPVHGQGILGDSLVFDQIDDYVSIPSSALLNMNAGGTIAFWIKPLSLHNGWIAGTSTNTFGNGNGWYIFYNNGRINYRPMGGSTSYSTTIALANQWHHIVVTSTAGGRIFYINGSNATSQSYVSSEPVATLILRLGNPSGQTCPFYGNILGFRMYSDLKSAAWVRKEYLKGAKAIHFQTTFDINMSPGSITSGYLENSPFEIDSGAWQINTEEIGTNPKPAKIINCIADGQIHVKRNKFYDCTPTEAAYGSFDFWIKHNGGDTTKINLISGALDLTSGYGVQITAGNVVTVEEWGVETKVAGGSLTADVWTNIRVTRTSGSVFQLFINGNLIGTSAADTTLTTSLGIVIEADAGTKIGYSTKSGGYSIAKYLGVVNPGE